FNADDSIKDLTDSTGLHTYSYTNWGGTQSDGCSTYSYDGFDRTASAAATGCGRTGSATYAYDGLDRQRSRTDPTSTALHYDGLNPVVSVETIAGTDTAYELSPGGQHMAFAVQ